MLFQFVALHILMEYPANTRKQRIRKNESRDWRLGFFSVDQSLEFWEDICEHARSFCITGLVYDAPNFERQGSVSPLSFVSSNL